MTLVCKSQACTAAPLGTRWPLVPLSVPLLSRGRGSGRPLGRDPGSWLCAPRDLAPQLEEDIRQRPLVSWRLLRTPGDCAALLQPRLERAMIRLACFIYSQKKKNTRARTANWATSLQGSPGLLFWQPRREDRHWMDQWYLCSYELEGKYWTHTHTRERLRARSMSSQWINV